MNPWIVVGVALGALLLFSRRSGASENADAAPENTLPDDTTLNPNPNPTPNGDDALTEEVRQLALGIAHAEGYFVAGSIPARANNPGDLVIPGWTGATLGDQEISVFASKDEGWRRLYRQLNLIFSDASHVYRRDMSFAEMGAKWTVTQSPAWTANVVEYLNGHGYAVDGATTLEDFFDGTNDV
jgi:hypothetical protein